MQPRRDHLTRLGSSLRRQLEALNIPCPSESQIVPLLIGASADALLKAEALQRHGFYLLPVRPPTVPEGTSRIRISLTAAMTDEEMKHLQKVLENLAASQ